MPCPRCGKDAKCSRSRKTGDIRCHRCAIKEPYYTNAATDEQEVQRQEIARWYVAGWKTEDLAHAFDCSKNTVSIVVRRLRPGERRKPGAPRQLSSPESAARDARIIAMHDEGKTLDSIAQKEGLSKEWVRQILGSYGKRRSAAETLRLRQKPKPEKRWSLQGYCCKVIPKEWWEAAYLQPDNPSTYTIMGWLLGMDDAELAALSPRERSRLSHQAVCIALERHGLLRKHSDAVRAVHARKRNKK